MMRAGLICFIHSTLSMALTMKPVETERSLVASFAGIATRDNLQHCLELSETACNQVQAATGEAYAIQLAVEEVCTNIVTHGYANREPGPMNLEFWLINAAGQRSLQILIRDEAPNFDPDSAPEPDINAELEDRRIGGLGWFLIKNLMDEFDYTPGVERGNHLRLLKHLGSREEDTAAL